MIVNGLGGLESNVIDPIKKEATEQTIEILQDAAVCQQKVVIRKNTFLAGLVGKSQVCKSAVISSKSLASPKTITPILHRAIII